MLFYAGVALTLTKDGKMRQHQVKLETSRLEAGRRSFFFQLLAVFVEGVEDASPHRPKGSYFVVEVPHRVPGLTFLGGSTHEKSFRRYEFSNFCFVTRNRHFLTRS